MLEIFKQSLLVLKINKLLQYSRFNSDSTYLYYKSNELDNFTIKCCIVLINETN